ncbi:hypothetical protein [Streptomyces collinus]|uniref:hypothetical protein n=1 Tax=Streptomyces collinus TaxID=42684 RepID=UPI00380CB702
MTVLPADELRTAAKALRKLIGQADDGPWETTWRNQQYHLDGYRDGDLHPISEWTYAIATWEPKVHEERAECDTANADYIAAMHPGIGAALADWLDSEAEHGTSIDPAALTLARRITAAAEAQQPKEA